MKIKKGDSVLILLGKDKGKVGKVIKSAPKDMKVLVEGVNMRKKTIKPKRQGEKGQIISVSTYINISNVKFVCPKCGKATRVGYSIDEKKKQRICKKCNQKV